MATQAPEITVSMDKPGAWARRLSITVPKERIAAERKEATNRLARQARLPGFRKGKVPTAVMEKRFGQAIEQETLEKVIGAAYREALDKENLQPITQGSINNVEYESGTDLRFDVEFDVRPEIELNTIGGFTLAREAANIDATQVDQVLQRLREEQALWSERDDGTPTAGDMVTVEITPLDDAMNVPPSQPRQYQIVIGEGQALPPIEDAIRTLKPGQEEEFNVDLPDTDENAAAGTTKPHKLRMKLVDIKEAQYPALDDEFAKRVGAFESLEDLKSRVKQDLEAEANRNSERAVRMNLITRIIEANPFDVPQSMINQYVEAMIPAREGADEEQIHGARMQAAPEAAQALQRMMVIERIAEMEGLEATGDELEQRVNDLAERMNRSASEVRQQLRKSNRLAEIEREITEDKVFEYLKSLSTIQ
jgi:trigger factor